MLDILWTGTRVNSSCITLCMELTSCIVHNLVSSLFNVWHCTFAFPKSLYLLCRHHEDDLVVVVQTRPWPQLVDTYSTRITGEHIRYSNGDEYKAKEDNDDCRCRQQRVHKKCILDNSLDSFRLSGQLKSLRIQQLASNKASFLDREICAQKPYFDFFQSMNQGLGTTHETHNGRQAVRLQMRIIVDIQCFQATYTIR